MGRLINVIPKTFFGGNGRKIESTTEGGIKDTPSFVKQNVKARSSVQEKASILTTKTAARRQSLDTKQSPKKEPTKQRNYYIPGDVTDLLTGLGLEGTADENDLETELQNVKRSFLYEQNSLVEKCELEKFELRESYEEETTRLRRAFENEKTELLKEIERKDKMLQELARVLKDEYESNLEKYKNEILKDFETKAEVIVRLQGKMNKIIENLTKIVENNEFHFQNMVEFKDLRVEQEEYVTLSKTLKSLSTSEEHPFECNDVLKNIPAKKSALSRSRSNPETNLPNQTGKRNGLKKDNIWDDEKINEIQHELADAYRKQKCELVKLFNEEKEEDRQTLEKQKNKFEKEVRTEYDSRMSVERKAWQDTIEDLEREIKILKYERGQMDHNYCVGMDEMRTEFEKEKQVIYKRYSDQQAYFEMKLKELAVNSS